MTTDHTPAEAGTRELARVAYLVREVRESLPWDWQGERHALQTIAARLDGHRCSSSVVPGDTATEADVLDAAWWLLNAPDAEVGTTDWRTARDEWTAHYDRVTGLLATAGIEGEAEGDGDLLWSLFHNGRTPPTYGDEETRRYYRHVASAFRAAASPQGEAQGQDDASRAVAPVGNVDRETLVEAFGTARVVNSDFVALEGGWTVPRDDEAERMADVALAALEGREQR